MLKLYTADGISYGQSGLSTAKTALNQVVTKLFEMKYLLSLRSEQLC